LKINELCHIAISCFSIEESTNFYENVFGFKVDGSLGSNNGNVKLRVSEYSYIELFPFEQYNSKGRGCIAHFALSVECLDSAISHMSNKNQSILRGPFTVRCKNSQKDISKVVFYSGPDGEEIELIQRY